LIEVIVRVIGGPVHKHVARGADVWVDGSWLHIKEENGNVFSYSAHAVFLVEQKEIQER